MDMQFSRHHLLNWAEFSGDFNPIHFDIERARLAGSEGIIVHGMLALLAVKQAADKSIDRQHDGTWHSVKARLKMPLQQDTSYRLSMTSGKSVKKFAVKSVDGHEELIQGCFTTTPAFEIRPSLKTVTLMPNRVQDKLEIFSKYFPNIYSLWIAIDAVVFADFIGSDILYESAKQEGMGQGAVNQRDLMALALTVQTFHTISISDELVGRSLNERHNVHSIEYQLSKANRVRTRPDAILGSHELDIYINQKFAMRSEIGTFVTPINNNDRTYR
jgi:hypothetical protein